MSLPDQPIRKLGETQAPCGMVRRLSMVRVSRSFLTMFGGFPIAVLQGSATLAVKKRDLLFSAHKGPTAALNIILKSSVSI